MILNKSLYNLNALNLENKQRRKIKGNLRKLSQIVYRKKKKKRFKINLNRTGTFEHIRNNKFAIKNPNQTQKAKLCSYGKCFNRMVNLCNNWSGRHQLRIDSLKTNKLPATFPLCCFFI